MNIPKDILIYTNAFFTINDLISWNNTCKYNKINIKNIICKIMNKNVLNIFLLKKVKELKVSSEKLVNSLQYIFDHKDLFISHNEKNKNNIIKVFRNYLISHKINKVFLLL